LSSSRLPPVIVSLALSLTSLSLSLISLIASNTTISY
jgi:hypothetical protein